MINGENTNKDYTVLIVDDDESMRELLKENLRRAPKIPPNIEVLIADSVNSALKQFRSSRNVDLVLLDYVGLPSGGLQMPVGGFAGDYVVRLIKESNPSTYVIGMTAEGNRDVRNQALDAGIDDFLEKPIYSTEFNKAIERAISGISSLYDPLTGLLNRRGLEDRLMFEVRRLKRLSKEAKPAQFTTLMFDLDTFKNYNDIFGHPQGDQALVQLAKFLSEHARPIDTIARYGGEEFALLIQDTSLERGIIAAERLLKGIRYNLTIPWLDPLQAPSTQSYTSVTEGGKEFKLDYNNIRATGGLASGNLSSTLSIDDLYLIVAQADRALVNGKGTGIKNTLYVYDNRAVREHKF